MLIKKSPCLLSQGASPNLKTDDGSTPLHFAAWQNAHETATVLLANGANPNAKTNAGSTPLHIAASQNAHRDHSSTPHT